MMKAKLGKLAILPKVQYQGYKGLLKKSILATLNSKETDGMTKYVMLSGERLNWKCGGQLPEKPMLFLDQNYSSLVKDLKADKNITLKHFSYGRCKLMQNGSAITVYLCPEKGKLAQPAQLKPLQKVFKTFKPKVYFEVVASLDEVQGETADSTALEDNTQNETDRTATANPKRAAAIGQRLMQLHTTAQTERKQLKEMASTAPVYMELKVSYAKRLKQLQQLCKLWEEDVAPFSQELELKANWLKVYDYWTAFFLKKKATKTEKKKDQNQAESSKTEKVVEPKTTTTTEDKSSPEEDKIYMETGKRLEEFYDKMEKETDPDLLEVIKDVASLRRQLNQWQAVVKKQGFSLHEEELKTMQDILKDLDQQLDEAREADHANWVNNMTDEEFKRAKDEGKYYKAAEEALRNFFQDIEKFAVTNPAKVDKDIAELEQHFNNWKQAIKGMEAMYKNDLNAMQEAIEKVKKQWAEATEKRNRYEAVITKLEEAIAAKAPQEEINQLIQQAEAIAAV